MPWAEGRNCQDTLIKAVHHEAVNRETTLRAGRVVLLPRARPGFSTKCLPGHEPVTPESMGGLVAAFLAADSRGWARRAAARSVRVVFSRLSWQVATASLQTFLCLVSLGENGAHFCVSSFSSCFDHQLAAVSFQGVRMLVRNALAFTSFEFHLFYHRGCCHFWWLRDPTIQTSFALNTFRSRAP